MPTFPLGQTLPEASQPYTLLATFKFFLSFKMA